MTVESLVMCSKFMFSYIIRGIHNEYLGTFKTKDDVINGSPYAQYNVRFFFTSEDTDYNTSLHIVINKNNPS